MSFVKYRLKEVAADFGVTPKEIGDIISKFYERPKSNSQVLTDQELNVVFEVMTQTHQIDSLEQVFAAQKPKEEPKKEVKAEPSKAEKTEASKAEKTEAPKAEKAGQPAAAQSAQSAKPEKTKEPERRRERRIVDTSAVQVNSARFDDRVDALVSERVQNYQGGKQRIGGKKGQQQNKKDNKFRGNKSRNEEQEKLRRLQMEVARKAQLTVKIPEEITVGELASRMKKTAGEVIKLLMKNGVMAAINQTIDFDTAEFVATEMGCKVEKEVTVTIEEQIIDDHVDTADELENRAPVVVVMGHVDHGKTSLLDAIRKTSVTAGEAGGITQHIGAYTVDVNGNTITFLDTPGHAAFTSMRARGAMCTDIAILVVAADDGIMPQTIESINHAKAAGVKLIVAINKMDKPTANPERVKEQLTQYEIVPEDWGGEVACLPVSAVTGMGISDLLERIVLEAEVMELKANPSRRGKGAVVEARLDKGQGPIATLLVQNGTLHKGDCLIAGTSVGRVRTMRNDKGMEITEAGPSTPVEITGLTEVPEAGELFEAVEDERLARELADQRTTAAKEKRFAAYTKVTLDNLFDQMAQNDMKELPIIVKADVQGSAEAVKQSLEKLSNEEVRVRVIHAAVGAISKSDVTLADASNAIIIGFNVRPDAVAKAEAEQTGVEMRMYRVIYDAINDVSDAMKGMLAPKIREVALGEAQVRMVYKISSVGTVAGCRVTNGKITRDAQLRLVRDGIVICEDAIASLKRFKDDAKEVAEGFECGITLQKFGDIKEGDVFECFKLEEYRE